MADALPPPASTGLASVACLHRLRQLDLHNCHRLSGAGLALLAASLEELAGLGLRGCAQLSDQELAGLVGLTALQALNLQGCTGMQGSCLKLLASSLQQLAQLNMSGCSGLGDAGIAHLAGLKALRSLDVSGCGALGLAGLAQVSLLLGLTELRARGVCNRREAPAAGSWLGWAQLEQLQVGPARTCARCWGSRADQRLGLSV